MIIQASRQRNESKDEDAMSWQAVERAAPPPQKSPTHINMPLHDIMDIRRAILVELDLMACSFLYRRPSEQRGIISIVDDKKRFASFRAGIKIEQRAQSTVRYAWVDRVLGMGGLWLPSPHGAPAQGERGREGEGR
jgi:hypothetical protein